MRHRHAHAAHCTATLADLGMGHKMRAVGGHGGQGGDVIIEASQHMNGLSFQTYVVNAPAGEDATGSHACRIRRSAACVLTRVCRACLHQGPGSMVDAVRM